MEDKLAIYMKDVLKNNLGASNELINSLQKGLDFELPHDYKNFMTEFNGGEGEIGENSWLCLFSIEELISVNKNYILLMKQIPDYFLFGKDAADTGYAFQKTGKTFHSFGLMSNFQTDPMEFCGNTFNEFIEYLFNQ